MTTVDRKIKNIFIHCSDSPFGCSSLIDMWHRAKRWRCIGYNFVIQNGRPYPSVRYQPLLDGQIEQGRDYLWDTTLSRSEIGAHTLHHNKSAVGICLIGKDSFTRKQILSVYALIYELLQVNTDLSIEDVLGHYESKYSNGKTCPNLDMNTFRKGYKVYLTKDMPVASSSPDGTAWMCDLFYNVV